MRRNSVRAPPSDVHAPHRGALPDDAGRGATGRDDTGRHAADPRATGQAGVGPGGSQRRTLVIASGNPGKLREFRELLADLPFDVVAQSELGLTTAQETGTSFLENALLKARHASREAGAAAIADDSGLEVDALGGAPGIYSARYAGPGADDGANNAKLLAALAGTPDCARGARYRCVLVFVDGPFDPLPLTAEGVWEGSILDCPRGSAGFGYDAYFWVAELHATAAELAPAEKNRRSHRGSALRALRAQLLLRAQPAVPERLARGERSAAGEQWAVPERSPDRGA